MDRITIVMLTVMFLVLVVGMGVFAYILELKHKMDNISESLVKAGGHVAQSLSTNEAALNRYSDICNAICEQYDTMSVSYDALCKSYEMMRKVYDDMIEKYKELLFSYHEVEEDYRKAYEAFTKYNEVFKSLVEKADEKEVLICRGVSQ